MKNTFRILLAALLLVSCGNAGFGGLDGEDFPGTGLIANADISLLRDHYYGIPFIIAEDITIEGYITANDRSGNLYGSFIIQDSSGAIEVCAGISGMHNLYSEGRRIVVKAKGLAVGSYNGIIQLGRTINTYSSYKVENFGHKAILERHVYRDSRLAEVEPEAVAIRELGNDYRGKLIRTDRMIADEDAAATWAVKGGNGAKPSVGEIKFRDSDGDSIVVVTSGYADFAGDEVPSDSVSLTGILLWGKFGGSRECYGLMLRNRDDIRR